VVWEDGGSDPASYPITPAFAGAKLVGEVGSPLVVSRPALRGPATEMRASAR